jgi:hypothetical protein
MCSLIATTRWGAAQRGKRIVGAVTIVRDEMPPAFVEWVER